jgi:polyphenol oxidase
MKNQEIKFVSLKKITTPPGVRFFFTTRQGGESLAGYGGLNLGLHVGDDRQTVINNRQKLMETLSPKVEDLVFINQVHGAKTICAPFSSKETPDGDALVTKRKNLAIGVMTADCVPILLADVENQVVGAAHAGWRGAADGILESCIKKMQELGAKTENIFAVIGPAIRPPYYAVDDGFRDHFLDQEKNKIGLGCQNFFSCGSDTGIIQFDLPGYVRERLEWSKLSAKNIVDLGLCTYALDNQFFSHRRTTALGQSFCGRQMGGIYLC